MTFCLTLKGRTGLIQFPCLEPASFLCQGQPHSHARANLIPMPRPSLIPISSPPPQLLFVVQVTQRRSCVAQPISVVLASHPLVRTHNITWGERELETTVSCQDKSLEGHYKSLAPLSIVYNGHHGILALMDRWLL